MTGMNILTNGEEVAKLAEEWQGVVRMRERLRNQGAAADALYNLPLLLAFDVLRSALRAIKKEGRFSSDGNGLRALMKAAEKVLPWVDYKALRKGAKRRNAVARDGELHPAATCQHDIDNVAAQLRAWGVGAH
jgi:hypothetical protein